MKEKPRKCAYGGCGNPAATTIADCSDECLVCSTCGCCHDCHPLMGL